MKILKIKIVSNHRHLKPCWIKVVQCKDHIKVTPVPHMVSDTLKVVIIRLQYKGQYKGSNEINQYRLLYLVILEHACRHPTLTRGK